jgi:PAS domain S-box-containing protein
MTAKQHELAADVRANLLFDEPDVGRCLVGVDGRVLRANAEWLRSTGFAREDVLGANIIDLFPETRDMALAMHARARAGHRVLVPRHAQRVEGHETWWEGSIAPVPMEDGTGLLITAREIGPAALDALRETEARYRTLFESMGEGFCVIEVLFDEAEKATDFRFVEVNQAFERHTGLVKAIGRRMRELAPSIEELWFETYGRVALTGEPARLESQAQALGRWYDVYAYRVGAPEHRKVAILSTDVTERKRASEALSAALREAEAERRRLAAVLDALPAGVAIADAAGKILRFNDALTRIWGSPPVPQSAAEYAEWRGWWPASGKRLEAHEWAMARALSTGEVVVPGDVVEIEKFDGSGRATILNAAAPIRNAGGEIVGGVLAEVDITAQRRAEESLHGAVERYEHQVRLFERVTSTTPDFVYVFDLQGRFLYANRRLLEVWGMQLADVIGKTTRELGYEQWHHDMHMREIAQVIATKGPIKGEVPFKAPLTGIFGIYEYIFTPVIGPDGEVESIAGTTRDVTERKRTEEALRDNQERLERERARLQAVIDTIPVGFFLVEASGKVVVTNDEAKRIWAGTVPLEKISDYAEYVGYWPDTGERLKAEDWPAAHALSHGRSTKDVMVEIERFDGTRGTILFSGAPIRDATGSTTGAVVAIQDISDLHAAHGRLAEVDRRKTEFLAMLSHELRNPLAPIRNSIYLLERAAPDSEQATRARDVVRRQTEHLTRLVDDLLDVTRISHGKIPLERSRVDLREIVRKTTDDLHSVFTQAGISLRVDHVTAGPIWTDADSTRMSQVLTNLLNNSMKFTPSGGTVRVTVAARSGRAELCVIDDGIGMEPEDIEHMFEPFAQADHSLARTKGGLGLGLALVKSIVELHGGSVAARSEGPGRGAEFLVGIPLAHAGSESERLRHRDTGTTAQTILVIEDNADGAQSLADILEMHGHHVRIAHDGLSGIALAREVQPDVILCDIGLPDVDGYDVARTLRRDGALRGTRVVALSGYAQPEDRQRARDAGFDVHLAKPVELDELMAALAKDS